MLSTSEIEEMVNKAWEKHDEAKTAGNHELANEYATIAFKLLGNLPENELLLRIRQ